MAARSYYAAERRCEMLHLFPALYTVFSHVRLFALQGAETPQTLSTHTFSALHTIPETIIESILPLSKVTRVSFILISYFPPRFLCYLIKNFVAASLLDTHGSLNASSCSISIMLSSVHFLFPWPLTLRTRAHHTVRKQPYGIKVYLIVSEFPTSVLIPKI